MSKIDNVTITDLVIQAGTDAIQSWSEVTKKEFVGTFDQRVKASKWILSKTAQIVLERAERRKFISRKHTSKLDTHKVNPRAYQDSITTPSRYGGYGPEISYTDKAGGRDLEDLEKIASERAETILKELPSLMDAVRIISPDVADMIERRDKIIEKGQKLQDELEPLTGTIDMDDQPETMTLRAFKEMLKERDTQRKSLLKRLNDLGEEGQELEDKINKALYAGLPGLSEAVMKVVSDHMERITAFDTMNRRVAEKVMFGDSEAAMSILTTFEKDEVEVSDNIKGEFSKAMDKLRLSATARKAEAKALKAKKD